MSLEKRNKPELDYIEYHISYHCNLKCKGCSHYSNIASPEFGDLSQFESDLKRLGELFSNIRKIRLLGGEPLLNVELPGFINVARSVFKNADIRVVTNGLLIPKIDPRVFCSIHDNNAIFDITQYPPTQELIEKIKEKCDEYGVKYSISPLVKEFFDLRNNRGDSDPEEMFNHCISRTCHFLENGKISLCPRPLIYAKYGERVGINDDFISSEIIDIYDDVKDGEELLEKFSKPIESCRYCDTVDKKLFTWEGNHPYI